MKKIKRKKAVASKEGMVRDRNHGGGDMLAMLRERMGDVAVVNMTPPDYYYAIQDNKPVVGHGVIEDCMANARRVPQVIPAGEVGRCHDLPALSFRAIQETVRGMTEWHPVADGYVMIMNENGLNERLQYNNLASEIMGCPIVGDVVLGLQEHLDYEALATADLADRMETGGKTGTA